MFVWLASVEIEKLLFKSKIKFTVCMQTIIYDVYYIFSYYCTHVFTKNI